LAQLLPEELGSCVRRISVRIRNRKLVFAFGTPLCPPSLCELDPFQWCDFLHGCTRNTTQLQPENPRMELLDVPMAVQSWIGGIEFGVRACSESQYKGFPFCDPCLGSNCYRALSSDRPPHRPPHGPVPSLVTDTVRRPVNVAASPQLAHSWKPQC
jgi:hypothetical protein